MAKKILVVLTSVGEMPGSGKPTGWYLPEFAHPYQVFKQAGYDVTVVSPKGGEAPLDQASVEFFRSDPISMGFYEEKADLWAKTGKISEYLGGKGADEFDALFYPGGHGPMFDLAVDAASQQLIGEFAARDKVVAAVCHGPCVFVGAMDPKTGENMLKGKTVTGFSNAEEDAFQMSSLMPFMLEDKLNEVSGGNYVKAPEKLAAKVCVEGKLITGQNPASSQPLAEEIVQALGK